MSLSRIVCICVLSSALVGNAEAQQNQNPVPILGSMIHQFQTGTPNPAQYGPQLWQLLTMQTQGTGVYWQLRNLGPVGNIIVNGRLDLPQGTLYSMTALHVAGRSDWRIGINRFTNVIEYADSAIGQNQPFPLPSTHPTGPIPVPGPIPGSGPNPVPNPGPGGTTPTGPSTSDACAQFPDLC